MCIFLLREIRTLMMVRCFEIRRIFLKGYWVFLLFIFFLLYVDPGDLYCIGVLTVVCDGTCGVRFGFFIYYYFFFFLVFRLNKNQSTPLFFFTGGIFFFFRRGIIEIGGRFNMKKKKKHCKHFYLNTYTVNVLYKISIDNIPGGKNGQLKWREKKCIKNTFTVIIFIIMIL